MAATTRFRARRALLLAAGLVVVATPAASSAPAAHASRGAILTVATLAVEPAAVAFYAKEEGYFAKQGLDVKIVVLSDPQQLAASVLSGDAQFSGFNVGGAALLKSRNAPIRLVAAGAVYRPGDRNTAVVAAPGEKIRRPRDLIGKTIAIDQQNTIAHIGLLKWLKAGGVSAGEVHLVETPFPDMPALLKRGAVDAATLPEPYLALALRNGSSRVASPLDAVCAQECLLTVWLTRRDMDAGTAARFRNAIQAAAVWANKPKHGGASAAILAKYSGLDLSLIAKIRRTRFATRLRPAQAQPWIDAYAEFGAIPASFRALDLVR